MSAEGRATGSAPARLTPAELAAWQGFLRAHASLVGALDAELRRDSDLPLSAYEVLLALAQGPPDGVRMKDLAEAVLLSRSGLTRVVDDLEAQGLVERRRCDGDGRGFNAVLTAPGRARLRTANVVHLDGVRRRFLDRLTPGQHAALGEAWAALLAPRGRVA